MVFGSNPPTINFITKTEIQYEIKELFRVLYLIKTWSNNKTKQGKLPRYGVESDDAQQNSNE